MSTHYEIQHGTGIISIGDKYSWVSEPEAIQAAKGFKEDPQSNNKHMTNENAQYWKKQTYTVVKKTISIEKVAVI